MAPPRRRSVQAVILAAVFAATGPGRAHASGQSGGSSSGSGSGDSSNSKGSNSSNGSGDSSNSSKGSSDNSRASSKDSNNSTQNSPKNSSDYTTHHSSDWSTKSRNGHIFSIALVVVSVGATVVGVMARNGQQQASRRDAERELAAFMRRQHPLLTHDVATGRGAVLAAWAHDLGLDAAESARFERALEGSSEQGALLAALDGTIDEARARRFAEAFLGVTARALGPARTKALVERAVRATGMG